MTQNPRVSSALRVLKPGARCALISPSGPAIPENIERAVSLVRSWGLEPVLGPHAAERHPRAKRYLAGTDEARAADLMWAWTDPSIDAIFCLRGGYGAIRLLDRLDVTALCAAVPKPLFGSSDITALHEFWQREIGVPTWFAPMVATKDLLDDPHNIESVRKAALGEGPLELSCDGDTATLVSGTARGELTGGNLSLIAMNIGSRSVDPERARGRIVLIEEIEEPLYKLDSLMHALLRSRYFDGVAGIMLGVWTDCGPEHEIRALMEETLAPLGVPVVWGLRFGHGHGVSTFPVGRGVTGTLFADDNPRFAFDSPER